MPSRRTMSARSGSERAIASLISVSMSFDRLRLATQHSQRIDRVVAALRG